MPRPNFWLTINGQNLASATIADITINQGRATVYDETDPADISIQLYGDSTGLHNTVLVGKRLELFSSVAGTWRMFSGLITDITATYTGGQGEKTWLHVITATGPLAELGRTPANFVDYPLETDSQRIFRVLNEIGYSSDGVSKDLPGPNLLGIIAEDDPQPAIDLINEAAKSGGGLLWEDHHLGLIRYSPRILRSIGHPAIWDTYPGPWDEQSVSWNEVTTQSASLWDLTVGNWDDIQSSWANIDETAEPLVPWQLNPHIVILDDWEWAQQVGDLITWIEIQWGDEETGSGGVWFEGNLIPPVYSETVDTILADLGDAQELANRIIINRQFPRWNVPALRMRLDRGNPSDWDALLELLIGGRPVLIDPMPIGSPIGPNMLGFLEGWNQHIAIDGEYWLWEVTLHISPAELTAPMTMWDHAGMLTWDNAIDPWNTLILTGTA